MQIKKPEFWDLKKPSLYSYLLWPLSKIIEIISLLRIKKKKNFLILKQFA